MDVCKIGKLIREALPQNVKFLDESAELARSRYLSKLSTCTVHRHEVQYGRDEEGKWAITDLASNVFNKS
jgi:hypothetical protein